MNQLSLFGDNEPERVISPEYDSDDPAERFRRFHERNPQVLKWMRYYSLRIKQSGKRSYGIFGIAAAVRYDYTIRTQGDDYKINNNLLPFYARLLMESTPELEGFFELRTGRHVGST